MPPNPIGSLQHVKIHLIVLLLVFTSFTNSRPNCVAQFDLFVVEQNQTNTRLLQTGAPHQYRIKPDFTYLSANVAVEDSKLKIMRRMTTIAITYFKSVIQVTTLNSGQTLYPSSAGACSYSSNGNRVPTQYTSSGFDPTVNDAVIFVESQLNQGFVAAAAPCVLQRWPTYGFIVFDADQINNNINNRGTFHSNVYVTMHQITHILGLNFAFYNGRFFTSYSSSTRLPLAAVVRNANSRSFIITSRVRAYVQNYFNCNDGLAGGALEDQGGDGTAGSHWERKIYLDQMMTGSVWSNGLKISQLTLNLLMDTGFYFAVDTSKAERFEFGRNRGCNFATGTLSPSPEFCSTSSTNTQCDFYSSYGGQCAAVRFSNNQKVISPNVPQDLCMFQEFGSSNFNGQAFGPFSKCFDTLVGGNSQPLCFTGVCQSSETRVKITINNQDYICNQGDITVSIPGGTITCPNLARFCARTGCDTYCNLSGVCVNGTCINASTADLEAVSSSSSFDLGLLLGILIPVVVIVLIVILVLVCICCACCKRSREATYVQNQAPPTGAPINGKTVPNANSVNPNYANGYPPQSNPYGYGYSGQTNPYGNGYSAQTNPYGNPYGNPQGNGYSGNNIYAKGAPGQSLENLNPQRY